MFRREPLLFCYFLQMGIGSATCLQVESPNHLGPRPRSPDCFFKLLICPRSFCHTWQYSTSVAYANSATEALGGSRRNRTDNLRASRSCDSSFTREPCGELWSSPDRAGEFPLQVHQGKFSLFPRVVGVEGIEPPKPKAPGLQPGYTSQQCLLPCWWEPQRFCVSRLAKTLHQ
jgi:hypothetical protein